MKSSPRNGIRDLLKHLYLLGISHSSVRPDLDGLASELREHEGLLRLHRFALTVLYVLLFLLALIHMEAWVEPPHSLPH